MELPVRRDDEDGAAEGRAAGGEAALSLRVRRIPLAAIKTNRLSGNAQDASTYQRLRKGLERWGMVELPVVIEEAPGEFRMIAGHHRVRAWEEIGHEEADCIVLPPEAIGSREEEFNLVNELNRVRGQTSDSELLRIVRREGLEAEAIDVHGLPAELLAPRIRPADLAAMDQEAARRARVLELTHRVSREIAQVMVDERNELLTVLVVEDKVAAVFRLPMRNVTAARKVAPILRDRMGEALSEALSEAVEEA